ncbi:MAG TPA: polyhydroxyalkanoate synthesis regulator DNA-binding domain-containing protein [Myxococcota bacterium]|jgi:polyhydroxyalkanoate synthesis repressor PhaR
MTTTKADPKKAKVIKRYANRKLYDTERSCYVTLDEIAQMIKEGDDVQVVDNKSKDDLTAVTLAQIIVEEEKKVQKMPLKLLRSIIQGGNDAIGEFYSDKVVDPVKRLRDDVQGRVESLLKRDGAPLKPDDAPVSTAPTDGAAGNDGVVKEFVHSTSEAFETWQKRIDERVREAFAKVAPHRPDLDALKARIDALEARLSELAKAELAKAELSKKPR